MLNLIAVFLVCSGIGIAVHIAIDLTHRPQINEDNECSLGYYLHYGGSYLALWAYNKFGRSSPMKAEDDGMKMDMSGMKDMSDMKGMDMSGMKDNMEMDYGHAGRNVDARNATSLLAIGSFCRRFIVVQDVHWQIS